MAFRLVHALARPIAAVSLILPLWHVATDAHANRYARAARAGAHLTASPVYVQWLRVDPRRPLTLYVGGTFRCAEGDYTTSLDDQCTAWLMRSSDGGATWSDLSTALGVNQTYDDHNSPDGGPLWDQVVLDPPVLAEDGQHLYAEIDSNSYTPSSGAMQIESSADEGRTWQTFDGALGSYNGYGAGPIDPVVSPVDPLRAFALDISGQGEVGGMDISRDGGATWSLAGDAAALAGVDHYDAGVQPLVPDPTRVDTIYANLGATVARSDDAGKTWSRVAAPPVTPALKTFHVATDPRLPGTLVGATDDRGVPADRRYLSNDGGRTWQVGACPGDLDGTCPRFTVANVFDVGHSYAFFPGGIYRFDAGGPTSGGARLAISDTLPAPVARMIDVASGAQPGDPIYILAQGTRGGVHGLLYRSADGGKRWRALPAGLLPSAMPPSTAPGALLVSRTRHSVAAPFVAAYRKLGVLRIGYPVDEAYLDDDVLTQDFEHLRLQARNGAVTIAPLGSEVLAYGTTPDQPDDNGKVSARPDTPMLRYFPSTGHTLQGAFLRFWQRHGGMAVFGAPITEPFRSQNGDGSGRAYQMQYFENARLELHPENRNARYAVLLGLLGPESLRGRGWVTQRR